MQRFNPRRLLFDREVVGLMGLNILHKPLGFISQVLIARYFGAGEDLDAYTLAFFLVTFGDGALARMFTGALTPHLIKLKQVLPNLDYARYQNGAVGSFLLPGAAWIAAVGLGAGVVVSLVGRDLPDATADLTVKIIVVMALPGLLKVINRLGMAVLNLHQDFQLAGAMPVVNSVVMLVCIIALHKPLGIYALPAGFAISQIVQAPAIFTRCFRTRSIQPVRPQIPRADIRLIVDLGWLVFISEIFLTINAFLDRWFATGLEVGSISSLHYALVLVNFGSVLFATSLLTVMFPRISEFLAGERIREANAYIGSNLIRVAHLVVPASLAAAIAAPEIVELLFERGSFTAADSARTSGALALYVLGMPAMILNGLVTRVLLSYQLLREKIWLVLQYLLTNAALNFLLVGSMKVQGLALASTLAIHSHMFLSWWLLHHRQRELAVGQFMRTTLYAYGMGLVSYLLYSMIPLDFLNELQLPREFALAISIATRAGILLAFYLLQLGLWLRFRR